MPPFGVNIDLINKRTLHHQISEFCLQQYSGRLEFFQEGNEIRRIKIDGGCYEVYAITEKGERVEAYFHPLTLAPVPTQRR